MKFKICGDLDCPDWILAEVFSMSKLSVVKLRLACSALVKSLKVDAGTAATEAADPVSPSKLMAKHTSDAKFTEDDNRGLAAALLYLLTSAVKFDIDADTFGEELQQLGLPKEHAMQLVKVYNDQVGVIAQYLEARMLRLSKLTDLQWRVQLLLGPLGERMGQVDLGLAVADGQHPGEADRHFQFSATAAQVRLLRYEVKRVMKLMEQLR